MTESDHAKAICRHLDAGAEQVSLRVQTRLAAARQQALSALPPVSTARPLVGQPAAGLAVTPARRQPGARAATSRRTLWWQIGAAAAPAALVLASLLIGDAMHQEQYAQELAEVDSALLTDDVPLMAYADHGFGVYLKNSRR